MPDTYLGYISPDTFQIQPQIHMYPMYSVLLVLGYNGYVTIHMWLVTDHASQLGDHPVFAEELEETLLLRR